MNTKPAPWPARFGLTTCTAGEIATAIPPAAIGVAVIYALAAKEETVTFLVLESRAGSLRDLCARRLQTAKFPADASLLVSFRTIAPADSSSEAIHQACREQVILAGELRRELRPAMR